MDSNDFYKFKKASKVAGNGETKIVSIKNVKRLYELFKPEHYDVSFSIDHDGFKFTGNVKITGQKTGRPSKRITLHQKDLKITNATISHIDKKGSPTDHIVARINKQNKFDEVRLHSEKTLYPGRYVVTLEFSGVITRPMDGIYPCFFESDGKKQHVLATQFESHHARQAFPCIDEPEAKATFSLTVNTLADHMVVSNTHVSTELVDAKNPKLKSVSFEKTPIMSTYLLAFVSGNLGFLEAKSKSGVVVRTYATPDNVEHTKFALSTAVKVLDFYEQYFDIKYPLAKCDHIALPDFAAGAMENWGCILYREQCMLVDPMYTSLATKQFAALVVAHELAHQWFGNLVTMKWWNDLWLNEGFASWIEYLAIDKIFPDWQLWTQFLVDDRETGLKLDALEHTHPIEVPVHHPDEIRSIFDAISYSKGASIINMLHEYLGAEAFRDGLRHYLKKHAYKNTITSDLWQSLSHVSGKKVDKFMHAWTSQPGFPVVKAVDLDDNQVHLSQSRFYLRKPATEKHQIWPIPILSKSTDSELLATQEMPVKVEGSGFIVNFEQKGFYRVVYDDKLLANLEKQITAGELDVPARLGILSDSFETAKAGFQSAVRSLELLNSYRTEDNAAVWDVMAAGLATIRSVMDDEDLREAMKPYIIELTAKQINRLGWDKKPDDSHFDTLLRPIVLAMAASADEPVIVKKCLDLFAKMGSPTDAEPSLTESANHNQINLRTEIDPDMRGVVYGTVARLGGIKAFDKLLKLHNQTINSEERTNIAAALTGFKQPELIDKALSLVTTDVVRLQDVAYWVAYSFMNRHARDKTWLWLKNNWQWLQKNFDGDLGFYRMPVFAARSFSSKEFRTEFEKFFETKRSPAFNRSIDQGLEILDWHIAWRERDLNPMQNYFKKQT